MNKKDMFKGFEQTDFEKHRDKYAAETKENYGDSVAYKESQEKMANYSKEDMKKIQEKGGEIFKKFGSLMDRDPSDPEVQEVLGEYRQYITDSFYNCTLEIFRGLGEMYVSDERFTKNIDQYGEGLSQFLKEAMAIYCDNQMD